MTNERTRRATGARRLIFGALLGLGVFVASASASAGQDGGSRRQGILDEFDANGDGRLSGDELEAAREAHGERHPHRRRHGERRRQRIERYDADGDGELTGDERRAARQARREHRRERWSHRRHRRESEAGPGGDADF